jgi:hypothetical protein
VETLFLTTSTVAPGMVWQPSWCCGVFLSVLGHYRSCVTCRAMLF